jgi:hypothetical protein
LVIAGGKGVLSIRLGVSLLLTVTIWLGVAVRLPVSLGAILPGWPICCIRWPSCSLFFLLPLPVDFFNRFGYFVGHLPSTTLRMVLNGGCVLIILHRLAGDLTNQVGNPGHLRGDWLKLGRDSIGRKNQIILWCVSLVAVHVGAVYFHIFAVLVVY